MANKTFNTRVKNKRDTAANWEAVATTFQPLDGELIIVDTAAGKTRFKVGRYDTAKGRLLYYNEIPFTDEYLYNDLNESQGKIYDKLKGIDDKSIIEMTLESVFDNTKFVNYRIGLWQFGKTGFYKLNIPKRGTTATQLFLYAQKIKEDGTTPEDPFSQDNLLRISPLTGDKQVESVFVQVDYTDTDTLTVYKVQFLNVITFPGTININTYNKTTQKWDFTSVTESSAKWANNATQVSNALTLTKGDTTTKFDGSTAQTVEIPTKTSELTNDSFVSYTEQALTKDQQNQAKTNLGIDILTGNTTTVTPTQVKEAILAGRPIAITYVDNTYGNLTFTSFGYSLENNVVIANLVATSNGQYILADLTGIINTKGWVLQTTELGTSTDIANNYVKYSESQTLTDEQKATARTNIGAISSSELVQPDWNQNDETAKDYIKNKSLEVPYWEEFGTWTTTYSSFEDDHYLAINAANAILCLEVNNTRFENLTYTSGSYGSFTLGDIDTIGVKISNSGMGSSTNSLTVSETMFPDGVTSAHIYRKSLKKLPMDALPNEIDWVKTIDGDSIVTTSNRQYVLSNSYLGAITISADNASPKFDGTVRSAMLYKQSSSYAMPPSVSLNGFTGTSTLTLEHPDYKDTYVTADEMPYGSTLVGTDFGGKPVLLNPRRPIATSITSSSTNRQYAGAKAVYDYVNDKIPNNSNIVNGKTTGSLVMINASDGDIMFSPGKNSFSGGEGTLASGSASHTEGYYTSAQGDYSHAEGSTSIASGEAAHAEGGGSVAVGKNSHAEGTNCRASGEASHAEGKGTDANSGQHVQGKYNVEDRLGKYAHIVGNGTNTDTQSNAHTLDWSGNAWFAGDVYVGSTSGTNKDDGSKKLATEEYVDGQMTTINNQLGGLTGAMHFIGKAAVDITDGSTTDPQIANYTTKEKGDVILGKDDHKEFVWNGAIWEELGDEGSYALKTTTINGKALSDNITLTASDVGAASASTIETMQAAIDSKPSAADAVYTATAESTDGVAYTATVSGIDSLTVGASFIMIPNKASTSKAPTLNVNGLGAKPIRRRLSSLTTSLQQGYSTNWIALNKPFTVVYDGTAWVIEGLTKTDGADVYGAVAQATADAKGNNIADTYATIAMLQSLLPKVTTITLTSNWVGDASPYYQDIALSCVTETSIVDLQPTPEQLNSWQDDGLAFTTLSGNGTVRVYVAGGKPSSAISVQVRVQEVTVI